MFKNICTVCRHSCICYVSNILVLIRTHTYSICIVSIIESVPLPCLPLAKEWLYLINNVYTNVLSLHICHLKWWTLNPALYLILEKALYLIGCNTLPSFLQYCTLVVLLCPFLCGTVVVLCLFLWALYITTAFPFLMQYCTLVLIYDPVIWSAKFHFIALPSNMNCCFL